MSFLELDSKIFVKDNNLLVKVKHQQSQKTIAFKDYMVLLNKLTPSGLELDTGYIHQNLLRRAFVGGCCVSLYHIPEVQFHLNLTRTDAGSQYIDKIPTGHGDFTYRLKKPVILKDVLLFTGHSNNDKAQVVYRIAHMLRDTGSIFGGQSAITGSTKVIRCGYTNHFENRICWGSPEIETAVTDAIISNNDAGCLSIVSRYFNSLFNTDLTPEWVLQLMGLNPSTYEHLIDGETNPFPLPSVSIDNMKVFSLPTLFLAQPRLREALLPKISTQTRTLDDFWDSCVTATLGTSTLRSLF